MGAALAASAAGLSGLLAIACTEGTTPNCSDPASKCGPVVAGDGGGGDAASDATSDVAQPIDGASDAADGALGDGAADDAGDAGGD